jgi:molecular chaperone GrpE
MPGDPASSDNGTTPRSASKDTSAKDTSAKAGESAKAADAPARRAPAKDSGSEPTLAEIRVALTDLTATLGREHDRAGHREAIIDRLHEENQRLRHSELQAALDPVRAALYRLHDLVRRESEGTPEIEHVPALLAAIADEVVEVIARTGLEPLPVVPGDTYDAIRHRPAGVEQTADPERAGTVVAVRRTGFALGEKVVRRAEVIVAKAAPHSGEKDESSGTITEDATAERP